MKKVAIKAQVFMLIMFLSLALPAVVYSQPTAPDGDDADTPIDGGISLVLAAAGIVGIKKMRDNKKKSNTVHL